MTSQLRAVAVAAALLGVTAALPAAADSPPDLSSPTVRYSVVADWCRQLVKTDPEGFPSGWPDCLALAPRAEVLVTVEIPLWTPPATAQLGQSIREEARRAVDETLAEVRAQAQAAPPVEPPKPQDGAQPGCTTEREERDGMTRVVVRCEAYSSVKSAGGSGSVTTYQSQTSVSVVRSSSSK